MARRGILALLALSLLLAPVPNAPSSVAGSGESGCPDGCGTSRSGSVTVEDFTLPYGLYVPSGYAGEALPLVVMLHATSQDTDQLARDSDMNRTADAKRFFVAWPLHPVHASAVPDPTGNTSDVRHWRWADADQQVRSGTEARALVALVDQVAADVPQPAGSPALSLDRSRVFAAGFSAGGAMAALLGAIYPEVFRAVGVVGGIQYKGTLAPGVPPPNQTGAEAHAHSEPGLIPRPPVGPPRVAAIVIQGGKDPLVHPDHAGVVAIQFAQINDLLDGADDNSVDAAAEGCRDGVVMEQPALGDPVPHLHHRSWLGNATGHLLVERWMVDDMDHQWPRGDPPRRAGYPYSPRGNETLWAFFEQVSNLGGGPFTGNLCGMAY